MTGRSIFTFSAMEWDFLIFIPLVFDLSSFDVMRLKAEKSLRENNYTKEAKPFFRWKSKLTSALANAFSNCFGVDRSTPRLFGRWVNFKNGPDLS